MHFTQIRITIVLAIMLVMAISGCAQKEIRKPAPPQMPDWCKHTSGTLDSQDSGRLIVGIGQISGIKSIEMARTNSDGQARTEIGQLLTAYLDELLELYEDYQGEDGNETSSEELTEAREFFAKLNVRSAAIEDRYFDEGNNIWYSKSVVKLDDFVKMLIQDTVFSTRLNEFLKINAALGFDKLPQYGK